MRRTLAWVALWLVATAAQAAIPSAEKIAVAVAETNGHARRDGPLMLDVSLRVAGGGAQAKGVLVTHPTGLARLELKGPSGFIERHLLLGDDYLASRDAQMLEAPHPFLPPVFLLQSTSGATLSAALSSFGVSADEMALGRIGDHDCYVFGGRRPAGASPDAPPQPSLWVDINSYDPLRLVRFDGTEYRLGPIQVYDGIRLPGWIEIRGAGGLRARIEILNATRAAAPAAAFQTDWLTSPVEAAAPAPPAAP